MATVADFAAGERVQRPTLGVVLVRRRVDTATLKEALRAGVREVVKLDDLTGLTEACEASLELTRQVRGDAGDRAGRRRDSAGSSPSSRPRAAAARRRSRRTSPPPSPSGPPGVPGGPRPRLRRRRDRAAAVPRPRHRRPRGALGHASTARPSPALVTTPQHRPGRDPRAGGAGHRRDRVRRRSSASSCSVLKSMYDVVVVDTPPAFTDHVLAAFDPATTWSCWRRWTSRR